MSNIDEKFDKAEKVVKRTQKLILMVVGGIIAIFTAVYVGLEQIAPDEGYEEEYYEPEPIEYQIDSLDTLGYDDEPYEMMTEEGG